MYDVEQSKKDSAEIKAAFAKMFPLCDDRDLPWAICHIEAFLKRRIQHEVNEGAFHRESQVIKVLCEVSPLKTHVVDMARIVVDEAKKVAKMKLIGEAAGKDITSLYDQCAALLNMTKLLEKHPDGYSGPCNCKACQKKNANR